MRRVLVLRGGALGDFIVTLPALAALRARWPQARIELVGNATAAQLARARGLLDAVHSQHEARWSELFATASLSRQFAEWLADFDLVVSFWPDPEGELSARFPLHAAQHFISGSAMPTLAPAAAHYASALAPLGIHHPDTWFPLTALEQTPSESTRAARAGITIHPGSGSPRKNWPPRNWLLLLPHLPAPVTIVVGEAELETWEQLPANCGSVLRSPPLEVLVSHLSRTRLFLGHDSGISHLAAACGAPCVLLFGPTDSALWAPSAPHVRVLRRGPLVGDISVAEVLTALQATVAP